MRTESLESEPLSSLAKDGNEAILEKLDFLIEGQEELKTFVEELVEKIADLNIQPNSGFGYEQ